MNKLVSIITPAFNSEATLEKCILSVKNQTYKNIEHVVIDGASSDHTVEVIKKFEKEYNIKWISEKDKGITDAMNKGFNIASGEIFAWIDADNDYSLNIVEEVVAIFEKDPTIDIVYGNIDFVDESKQTHTTYCPPKDISFEKALIHTTGAIPLQPAVFFKNSIFKKAGGFDLSYKLAGDYDFWLRVLEKKPHIYYYDKIFGNYLKDEKGLSQSAKGIIRGYKEVVAITGRYNQPLHGKVILFIKYAKGYISAFVRYW